MASTPGLQLATAWQLSRRYNFLMELRILGSAAACRLSGDIVQRFSAIDSGARATRQIFSIFFTPYAVSRGACFGHHYPTT